MPKIQSISVIVPAYNEENDLRASINVIHKYLAKLVGSNFEILIVENGSTDKTADIAKELEVKYTNIKVFFLSTPSYGGAYRFGLLRANCDMVTLYPVDLAVSLDFIERAKRLLDKYPIVLGVRFHEKSKVDRPLIRILISKVHTILVNLFFGTHYNDVNCLKAFKTDIGKKLAKYTSATGTFIEVELSYLLKKTGIKFCEIPINHTEKEIARHLLYIVQSILKNFLNLFKYKFMNVNVPQLQD